MTRMSLIADETYTHPFEESIQSNTSLERYPSDRADPLVSAVPKLLSAISCCTQFFSRQRRRQRDHFVKPFCSRMFNTTLNLNTSPMNSTSRAGLRRLPLWYQYPLCAGAPYGFVFYYAVKMFNLAVGAPCNFLVIWQISTKKSDTCTSDIFIFNLAVLDAYFCLMTPVEMVNYLLLDDSGIWYFQRFAYGVKDLAVLFLVCICLDRYTAVVHPVLFSGIRDNQSRTGISVVVWGLILAYAVSKCILGAKSLNGVFSGVILFTFAVMVFCNISVMWVLRRAVAGNGVRHPVKQKAFKMVLTILGIIVVNYLPPVALMPFASYYTFVEFNCQIRISVFSLMDLSCSIEPLLYLTKMEFMGGRCCRCSFSKKTQDVIT